MDSVAMAYDTVPPSGSASQQAPSKQMRGSHHPAQEAPQKRARIQPTDAAETVEGRKPPRGRPRLETKDETAVERRRTQIRLAQRAYRNRKENALQTLEKEVQRLRDTNEKLTSAFMQLHDFAVASGLAETVPEFGRHLRATTERFLALTGDASSGSAGDSERGGSAKHDASVTAAHDEQISSSISEHTGSQAPTEPARAVHGCHSNWEDGGLAVVHEPATGPAVTANIMSSTSRSAAVPISDREDPCRLSLDHQSFPVGETPSWPDLPGAFPGASPRLSLHPPDSYASMEITFGRQLQRIALERGLILISMPNAPPTLVSRVFGFCLLFETRDDIISRLTRALGRTAQQCLYNWQFPFFHLGGAGTHLDAAAVAAAGHRIGNRGTADVLKPAASAGFATGPFSPRINEARDHQLDPGTMRMALPGFTGDFLDADEAEIYLFQRGVAIPPGADFVTVDIDPNHFDNGEWAAAGTGTLPHGSYYPAPVAAASSSVAASGSPAPSLGSGCAATVSDPSLPDLTAGLWPATAAGAGASLLEPLAMDGSVPHGHLSAVVASPAVGDALQRGGGMSGHGAACDAGQPSSLRRVVVDVQVLAREMAQRSICLGRTPGFRRADINEAFWLSIQPGVV